MFKKALVALALTLPAFAVHAGDTPSPEGAAVSFQSPVNGTRINAPFVHIIMNVEGMDVVPAGTDKPNSGHHHLLINKELTDEENALPADEQHIHFGKGQTEAKIALEPGTYTLQLVFADAYHVPHNPVVKSEPITIEMLRPVRSTISTVRFWPLTQVPNLQP